MFVAEADGQQFLVERHPVKQGDDLRGVRDHRADS